MARLQPFIVYVDSICLVKGIVALSIYRNWRSGEKGLRGGEKGKLLPVKIGSERLFWAYPEWRPTSSREAGGKRGREDEGEREEFNILAVLSHISRSGDRGTLKYPFMDHAQMASSRLRITDQSVYEVLLEVSSLSLSSW